MAETSRTRKTISNLHAGIIYQITSALLNFVVRKIFLEHISVYYLGLDGVFSNLINMMCLLDFGVGTAATYYLIRAASRNDNDDLLLTYDVYVKLYRIVALVLTLLSVVICFNISWFVSVDGYDINVIRVSFVLTFLRTIFFYLMSCPKTVFLCNQQNSYNMNVNTITTLIFFVVKAVTLTVFENFYVYLIVLLLENIVNYIIIDRKFAKSYPGKRHHTREQLEEKKQSILGYGKKIVVLNINTFIFNSTDNLVISKILGTITVGIMSMYYIIINAVQLFATQVIDAASASISNYINDERVNDTAHTSELVSNMCFICFAMGLFCSTCLFGLTDECIALFFGTEYVMPRTVILLFSINIMFMLFQTALQVFVNGRGLAMNEIKYAIAMAAVNLIVSIFGAMAVGVPGVLAGTMTANLIMVYGRSHILKQYLSVDTRRFWKEFAVYTAVMLIDIVIVQFLFPQSCNSLVAFIIRALFCLILIAVSLIPFYKTTRFQYSKNLALQILHSRSKKQSN
jgi:O-antigen/teichoic acid export membrane protein